eukprot:14885032-Alexandrium_andersonii.AAC.1
MGRNNYSLDKWSRTQLEGAVVAAHPAGQEALFAASNIGKAWSPSVVQICNLGATFADSETLDKA